MSHQSHQFRATHRPNPSDPTRRALASGPMGSSGLIYAAIVAAWAAVLVPRWVRRNEEIDQAREADLARGVRVLGPADSLTRGARTQARHTALPVEPADPLLAMDEPGVEPLAEYGQAARRRRRVLCVLILALVAVTVTAVIGKLPLWSVAVPSLLLGGFLRAARRAAATEANTRAARRRREPTMPAASNHHHRWPSATSPSRRRRSTRTHGSRCQFPCPRT